MNIPTKYEPKEIETKWYQYWLDNKFFHSTPDEREPYTIVIPPPNVTGVLHMGHMLNNTIQDVLVRRARMQGKNTCWVPGTDHASIATEAKVVAKLKQENIDKHDLNREQFLEHAWEWTHKHGGIILEQLKKLGASCDWERTKFTMDETLSKSVIATFIDLHNKGLIYRGIRMVNWDPQAKTAVSDEEVNYKEVSSKLYYLKYKIADSEKDYIIIATTRPETILGDTAVCINPKDERFKHLKGKKVIVPIVNREVPIIEDEYVDMEFGTGCLKITPAHDINDYEIGLKHNLKSIDIFNDDGTLNENAHFFVGEDRFKARELVTEKLKEENLVEKIEDYTNKIGYSERTDTVIEPKLSVQWFLKMEGLAKPALEKVMNDNIKFYPAKFKNVYKHWMENVKDWCISRQLWWGHQIPAYYINNTNEYVVAENIEKALEKAKEKTKNKELTIKDLKQDEDVVDTWFSSWLWPISVFDGINKPDNEDIKYYYPTNVLVTGHDIIFFWVARMIMSGYEYRNNKPFKDVYFTGMVRDSQRRKMSKQLGNSPDPLDLINEFGADGVRVGMLLCSPAGGDLLFDNSLPEQGRNFSNKIWNAFRLVKSWKVDKTITQPKASEIAIEWLENKLSQTINTIEQQFETYRISEALMSVYKLFRDDFSSWFLEIIKPTYQKPIDQKTYKSALIIFEKILKILHPFMPFITEELWQNIEQRKKGETITTSAQPKAEETDDNLLTSFELTKNIITNIRTLRKDKNIPNKDALELCVKEGTKDIVYLEDIIKKSANISSIRKLKDKEDGSAAFMVKSTEFFVPLGGMLNTEEERKKLTEQLEYTKGFLKSVSKKLANERFVNNAPQAVVNKEKAKKADAETKIKALEKQIAALS